MNRHIHLSERQREIVEQTKGSFLVLAAAGSGKTRVLTERIRHILSQPHTSGKVLALTFTNKAAAEMKERLEDIDDLEELAFVGTIHAFSEMLLNAHGTTIGLSTIPTILERDTDRLALLEEVVLSNAIFRNFHSEIAEKERRKWLYSLLELISECKRQLTGICDEESTFGDADAELLYRLYNERLYSQGCIDFDDVLLLAYRILIESPQVAKLYARIYRYICVDEAQDLNFVQYALIRELGSHGNVLMVGCENQAIYGFNGSSTTYMLDYFRRDFQVKTFQLRENYRSSKAVIRAANVLFPQDPIDESNAPIDGLLEIHAARSEDDEAKRVVDIIRSLVEKGRHPDIEEPVSLTSMAVLARNRYVFTSLEQELKRCDIPFYFRRTTAANLFESNPIRMFDLGVRILVNSSDDLHWRQLCEVLGVGRVPKKSVSGLENLQSLSVLPMKEFQQDFRSCLLAWAAIDKDLGRFGKAVVQLSEKLLALRSNAEGDLAEKAMVQQDINMLINFWKKYVIDVEPHKRSLLHFRNQLAMGMGTVVEERVGLPLCTVHSVKGLEFPIVFLIGMTEGTFPDYRAVKAGGNSLEEERNEAYVAITRAQRLLYITYPETRVMPWDRDSGSVTRQTVSRFVHVLRQ